MDRCVKQINKRNFTKEQNEDIMNEIKILKEIDHPHILKIFEYYEKKSELYIITEMLTGGDLYDKIEKMNSFNESIAAEFLK